MDNAPILKKTLVTMGAMVGAWVAFVGTVSLVAVLVTSHVVGASGPSSDGSGSVTTGGGPGARGTMSDPLHPSPASPPAHPPAQRAHDTI